MAARICGNGLRAVRGLQIPWNRTAAAKPEPEVQRPVTSASHPKALGSGADRSENKLVDILDERLQFTPSTAVLTEMNIALAAGNSDWRVCDPQSSESSSSDSDGSGGSDSDSESEVDSPCRRTVLARNLPDPSEYFTPEELKRYVSELENPVAPADLNKAEALSRDEFSDDDSLTDSSDEESGPESSSFSSPDCSPKKAIRTTVLHDFPDPTEYLKKRDLKQLRANPDFLSLVAGDDVVPVAPSRSNCCMELPALSEFLRKRHGRCLRAYDGLVSKGSKEGPESDVSIGTEFRRTES